ncbi:hypothetical protein D3C72_1547020 [compost metagenome]
MSSGKGAGGSTGWARGRRTKPLARACSSAATASRRSWLSAEAGTNQGCESCRLISCTAKTVVPKRPSCSRNDTSDLTASVAAWWAWAMAALPVKPSSSVSCSAKPSAVSRSSAHRPMRRSLDFLSSVRIQSMSRLRLISRPLRRSLNSAISFLGNTRQMPFLALTHSARLMCTPTSSFCRS